MSELEARDQNVVNSNIENKVKNFVKHKGNKFSFSLKELAESLGTTNEEEIFRLLKPNFIITKSESRPEIFQVLVKTNQKRKRKF